jgi:hypothetical protein
MIPSQSFFLGGLDPTIQEKKRSHTIDQRSAPSPIDHATFTLWAALKVSEAILLNVIKQIVVDTDKSLIFGDGSLSLLDANFAPIPVPTKIRANVKGSLKSDI